MQHTRPPSKDPAARRLAAALAKQGYQLHCARPGTPRAKQNGVYWIVCRYRRIRVDSSNTIDELVNTWLGV